MAKKSYKPLDNKLKKKIVDAMYNAFMLGAYDSGMMVRDARLLYGISEEDGIACLKIANNKFMAKTWERIDNNNAF